MIKKVLYSILLLSLYSCFSSKISRSSKKTLSDSDSPQGNANLFEQFQATINQNCVNCHNSNGNSVDFQKLKTQKDWLDSPFVSNSPDSSQRHIESKVYYRIEGSEGNNGPKSMPGNFDLTKISNWIQSIEITNSLQSIVVNDNGNSIYAGGLLDLGVILDGTTSTEKIIVIKNTSSQKININSLSFTDSSFTQIGFNSQELEPTETTQVKIKTSSQSSNEWNSELKITYNGSKEFKLRLKAQKSNLLERVGLSCSQSSQSKMNVDKVKAYSKTIFINNLKNLFGNSTISNLLQSSNLSSKISQYPEMTKEEYWYSQTGGSIQDIVNASWEISQSISQSLINNNSLFTSLMQKVSGQCTTIASLSSFNESCLSDFISYLGKLAFSRSLTATEKTSLLNIGKSFLSTPSESFKSIISNVMIHPEFNLIIDEGSSVINQSQRTYKRSRQGLLRNISIAVNDRFPDLIAIQMSEEGKLENKTGYNQILNHLKSLKNSQETPLYEAKTFTLLESYFSLKKNSGFSTKSSFKDGFMKKYQLQNVDVNQTMNGNHIADGIYADRNLLWRLVIQDRVNVQTLFKNNSVVTPNPLSVIAKKSAGVDPYAQSTQGHLGGMLYANSLMYSNFGSFRVPFHLGAWVMDKILCDTVPAPNPEDFPAGTFAIPELDGSKPSRQVFEEMTSSPMCIGCHSSLSAGYTFSHINPIGENVNTEEFYNEQGMEISSYTIDSSASVIAHGQTLNVRDSFDLRDQALSLGTPHLCISKFIQKDIYQGHQDESCDIINGYNFLRNSGKISDLLPEMVNWESNSKILKFNEN